MSNAIKTRTVVTRPPIRISAGTPLVIRPAVALIRFKVVEGF